MKLNPNLNAEIGLLLLNNIKDITYLKNNSKPVLHFAAKFGDSSHIDKFVNEGFSVEEKADSALTPSNTSLYRGCLPPSWAPIFFAAEAGNALNVQHLIERHHANSNATDYRKITPLHLACANGHLDTARVLVKHLPPGSTLTEDLDGRTALDLLIANRKLSKTPEGRDRKDELIHLLTPFQPKSLLTRFTDLFKARAPTTTPTCSSSREDL